MDPAPEDVAPKERSLTYRLAPFVLVAGAIAAAVILIPRVPHERRVELRLEDTSTIVGVRMDWLSSTRRSTQGVSDSTAVQDDPLQGTTWRFSPGIAPPSVTATVRLPDGPYDLEILVERVGRTDTVHRSLTLGDAEQITIPVR